MDVIVPLAEGFEEIEAVTIIDVLRRAGIEVTTAFLAENPVKGSHDIPVTADIGIGKITPENFDAIILPGGMPGSENLKNSDIIKKIINDIYRRSGLIGAICAAPMVFGSMGLLEGKKATCFPGFENELMGADYSSEAVVTDGNIITGSAAGNALEFAMEIAVKIKGRKAKDELKEKMRAYWL